MATDPGVPTIHNLADAKKALKTFQDLQKAIDKAGQADGVGAISNTMDLTGALGGNNSQDLMGAASKIQQYYSARASALSTAITNCQNGVAGIISMLQQSIDKYSGNETTNQQNADATGNGADGRGK